MWGQFRGEDFVPGKFRRTSNFGAGTSDAGNCYSPECQNLRPFSDSTQAHRHSRRRPTSQAGTMDGRDAPADCRQQRNDTRLPPPERVREAQRISRTAHKNKTGEIPAPKLKNDIPPPKLSPGSRPVRHVIPRNTPQIFMSSLWLTAVMKADSSRTNGKQCGMHTPPRAMPKTKGRGCIAVAGKGGVHHNLQHFLKLLLQANHLLLVFVSHQRPPARDQIVVELAQVPEGVSHDAVDEDASLVVVHE